MNGLEVMSKKVGIVSCSGEDLPGGRYRVWPAEKYWMN